MLKIRLKERHIDLYLRRNDAGRITGATFIDHETRCVLNGSRLGKAYSANAINERFNDVLKAGQIKSETPVQAERKSRRHTLR